MITQHKMRVFQSQRLEDLRILSKRPERGADLNDGSYMRLSFQAHQTCVPCHREVAQILPHSASNSAKRTSKQVVRQYFQEKLNSTQ